MRPLLSFALSIILLLNIETGFSMGKSPGIEQRITFSHKDTRSEAKHGHIYINGNELPDLFTFVICGKQAFRFYQRTQLWGNDGYFPIEDEISKITLTESSAEIDKDTLAKGWYKGKERLSGTPAAWLYVEWSDGSAYISPEKIKDAAAGLNLIELPRYKIQALMLKSTKPDK